MSNKDFLIDEETRLSVRKKEERDLIGVTTQVENVFGKKSTVQLILFEPNRMEVGDFQKLTQKSTGFLVEDAVSFLKKMLAYPEPKTEEWKELDKILDRYPIVAYEAITTVFAPSFKGKTQAKDALKPEDMLEVWEV